MSDTFEFEAPVMTITDAIVISEYFRVADMDRCLSPREAKQWQLAWQLVCDYADLRLKAIDWSGRGVPDQ